MKMTGKKVLHVKFGEGKIAKQYDNKMDVDFHGTIRTFLYPNAFNGYLTAIDTELVIQIEQNLADQEKEKNEQIQKNELELYRRTIKMKANSHAAFDLKEDEWQNVIEDWKISTNNMLKGDTKPAIRIPKKLNMNSVGVLTTKEKRSPESERSIVGIFMTEEDFIGEECENGVITAHEKYRLLCNPEEKICFWDYFPEEKRLKSWGNSRMKYISDSVVGAMIHSARSTAADEKSMEAWKEFEQYYSEANNR